MDELMKRTPRRGILARIRKMCFALPEASERLSHGAPTFFIRGKRAFVMGGPAWPYLTHLQAPCPGGQGVNFTI